MTAASSTYTPPANGFRTFLIVWITQSVSVFGSGLTVFALNIWMISDLYPLPSQKPALALVEVLFFIYQFFNPIMLRVEDREFLETLAAKAAVK